MMKVCAAGSIIYKIYFKTKLFFAYHLPSKDLKIYTKLFLYFLPHSYQVKKLVSINNAIMDMTPTRY